MYCTKNTSSIHENIDFLSQITQLEFKPVSNIGNPACDNKI